MYKYKLTATDNQAMEKIHTQGKDKGDFAFVILHHAQKRPHAEMTLEIRDKETGTLEVQDLGLAKDLPIRAKELLG